MKSISSLLSLCKGCITFFLLTLLFVTFSLIIIVTMSLCFLIPCANWRNPIKSRFAILCALYCQASFFVFKLFHLGSYHIQTSAPLKKQGWYLIIANHLSWLDILSASCFFKFKIPPLKFFMKKELLWTLPLGGLACYLADFPFIERANKSKIKKNPNLKRKDIKTTQTTCNKLLHYPSTLIIFPEGTRVSQQKQQRQNAPYTHLLKPKAAGIATVINEMEHKLDGIIDLTLCYTPQKFSIWDFLCGKVKQLHIAYDVIPITPDWLGDFKNDREYRIQIQRKLNTLWQKKDGTIAEMLNDQS